MCDVLRHGGVDAANCVGVRHSTGESEKVTRSGVELKKNDTMSCSGGKRTKKIFFDGQSVCKQVSSRFVCLVGMIQAVLWTFLERLSE